MITKLQRETIADLAVQTLQAKSDFAGGNDIAKKQLVLAARAFALYTELTEAGYPITFSKHMLGVRGVPPSDPSFFNSIHVLEDFFGVLNGLGVTAPSDEE